METAASADAALVKLVNGRFDVILTDRAMPGMNGDQLAAAAKTMAPATPIVMLTGFGEMMELAGERPAGIDLVVSKPVTVSSLRDALAEVALEPSRLSPRRQT